MLTIVPNLILSILQSCPKTQPALTRARLSAYLKLRGAAGAHLVGTCRVVVGIAADVARSAQPIDELLLAFSRALLELPLVGAHTTHTVGGSLANKASTCIS